MPTAFYRADRDCWIAEFRGPYAAGRTTLRVPNKYIKSATANDDARAFANECERYCRILEGPHDPEDVAHARRIGAITQPQADALLSGTVVPGRSAETKRLSLKDAALCHPSSQREKLDQQVYYVKTLQRFTEFTGIEYVVDLTLQHVTNWVTELRRKKFAWDSRRHALLYLRRAAQIGAQHGMPNVLAGWRLDAQDRRAATLRGWKIEQIIHAINTAKDPRQIGVLVLGGLLGLRPTEIIRAEINDLTDDVLAIGQREAKNKASIRSVPVPQFALTQLKKTIGRRTKGPIIIAQSTRNKSHLTISGLSQLMSDILTAPKISVKDLRKSFATWAVQVIPPADVERYLGHQTALVTAVTARHYLIASQVDALRPSARAIDAVLASI